MSNDMQSQVTPGPLEVSERFMTNEGQRAVMAPDAELGRKRVALVDAQKKFKRGEGWKLDDDPERDANAKLFAAAPDMLAALKNLENDDDKIPIHVWKLVQDAIAKAEVKR